MQFQIITIGWMEGVYKTDYAFRMNVTEEIFEIRSCIEILANDIKVDTTDQYMFYNYKVYILGDLQPLTDFK